MSDVLPVRFSADRRVATWNPALTRAAQVWVRVRDAAGVEAERRSVNSGRVRVRVGEQIVAVRPAME